MVFSLPRICLYPIDIRIWSSSIQAYGLLVWNCLSFCRYLFPRERNRCNSVSIAGKCDAKRLYLFSIATAVTPGYAGYKPTTDLKLLAGLEAIFGKFMWAAFIATFVRKYMKYWSCRFRRTKRPYPLGFNEHGGKMERSRLRAKTLMRYSRLNSILDELIKDSWSRISDKMVTVVNKCKSYWLRIWNDKHRILAYIP